MLTQYPARLDPELCVRHILIIGEVNDPATIRS